MKILNFNWAALDVRGGVKYTIGVSIVIALSLVIQFSWMAVGLSALLAWLVNVPGPRRERLTNIILFIVVGAALIGLVLGDAWLKSDPTLILQASLMIILPSAMGTWTVAVDRMIGLILGVVAGFYLGQFAGGQVMEIIVWISASFMLVTLMNVNAAAMIFFFVLPYSLVWGMLASFLSLMANRATTDISPTLKLYER
jgi:hypothetical protein